MRKVLLSGLISVIFSQLRAQPAADSVLYVQSLANAVKLFQAGRGDLLPIYSGIYYYGFYNVKGTAFYQDLDFRNGTVRYDGKEYYDIPMRYELVKDILVVLPPHDYRGIILFSPRVNEFSFDNHRFVYLDSLQYPTLPANGFYEELVKGKLTIYSRTTKILEERLDGSTLVRAFNRKNFLFAVKDSIWYRITSQASLMELIKDRKKEVMDLMKLKKKLRFRKAREETSREIARYYNQLTH